MAGASSTAAVASPLSDALGQPDEDSLWSPDVAEPIDALVFDHFVHDLRAVLGLLRQRVVEIIPREHDAQITERVHQSGAVIGDHGRRKKARQLESAVTVRRAQHGYLDAHVV